jgi:hypothetical protein
VKKLIWILRPIIVCVKQKVLFTYRHTSICFFLLREESQNIQCELSWKCVAVSIKISNHCLNKPLVCNVTFDFAKHHGLRTYRCLKLLWNFLRRILTRTLNSRQRFCLIFPSICRLIPAWCLEILSEYFLYDHVNYIHPHFPII